MEYKNLDVFVLTYNRAKYLKIMLDSLCTQTAKGFNIKVLNNASTDNTIEIVNQIQQEYPERNITIITNEKNIGNVGNFKHSQELATNEYTAIFHDDDAIHPEYIETAMKIFEKNSDIVMCSGNHIALWNVDNNDWHLLYKNYYKYKQKDAAYLNLLVNRPTFAANIYKTAAYKKIMYHPELYGKLHDVIFMIEMNKIGSTAFILGACIKWRQSIVSDSSNLKTGPFPNEIANIVHKIKELNSNHKLLGAPLLYNFACVYITEDNLEVLEEYKDKSKKKSLSNVINRIIDEFRKCKRYVLAKKEGYGVVKVSCRVELIELLEKLKENYGDEAVVQLINQRLLEEFSGQINSGSRRKYPDRLYSGNAYIERLAGKCVEHLKKFLKR